MENKKDTKIHKEKEEIITEEQANANSANDETANEVPVNEEAVNESSELKEQLIRTLAEFDNYKKRTQKEKESLYEFSVCEVVSKILPVYDTLSLSLNHKTDDEALKTGVELTLKQFKEAIEKLGVVEIEALGKPFDPNFHNAVMHIEDEAHGEKEIVEVLQTGYRLNDKVIRYSMVKVAN